MTSGFERSQESVFLFRTLFECRKALYALAKVLETFDEPIFAAGHIVSGHTLKHLAAAAAGYYILRMLQKRRPVLLLPSTISIVTHEKPS
jgi:hypothetical protein